VIITGAGAGLGRAYAHMYGKLGANVVVNDVSEKGANAVVAEVQQGSSCLSLLEHMTSGSFVAGGKAMAVICSAEDGEAIVKAALERFGGVHVLIANAGILRDKSFAAMSEQEWDAVIAVHLRLVSFLSIRSRTADGIRLLLPFPVHSGTYKVRYCWVGSVLILTGCNSLQVRKSRLARLPKTEVWAYCHNRLSSWYL
jgi:NAD(P)-dependent dehydrogenase (short-subunit alcohol dehydrogenase family)